MAREYPVVAFERLFPALAAATFPFQYLVDSAVQVLLESIGIRLGELVALEKCVDRIDAAIV